MFILIIRIHFQTRRYSLWFFMAYSELEIRLAKLKCPMVASLSHDLMFPKVTGLDQTSLEEVLDFRYSLFEWLITSFDSRLIDPQSLLSRQDKILKALNQLELCSLKDVDLINNLKPVSEQLQLLFVLIEMVEIVAEMETDSNVTSLNEQLNDNSRLFDSICQKPSLDAIFSAKHMLFPESHHRFSNNNDKKPTRESENRMEGVEFSKKTVSEIHGLGEETKQQAETLQQQLYLLKANWNPKDTEENCEIEKKNIEKTLANLVESSAQFSKLYQAELLHWIPSTYTPVSELGTVATSVYEDHQKVQKIFDSIHEIRESCSTLMKRLHSFKNNPEIEISLTTLKNNVIILQNSLKIVS